MPRSRRPAGELLGAGQDPLPGAPLFPRPSATSSSSGRARSRVSAQVRVARLANHALRVLRALFTGDLTSVAADSEVPWGSNKVWDGAREIERQVSLRVHGCCQHAFDSGVYAEEGESAFGRLTSTGPYPGPSASSQDGVPVRGAVTALSKGVASLPPSGTVPTRVVDLSARVSAYFADLPGRVLKPADEINVAEQCAIRTYSDPCLR